VVRGFTVQFARRIKLAKSMPTARAIEHMAQYEMAPVKAFRHGGLDLRFPITTWRAAPPPLDLTRTI
jgi:hypothetical protein